MKSFFVTSLFGIILVLGVFVPTVSAQNERTPGEPYILLQPIPLQGSGAGETENVTPGQYLKGIFMLIIGVAGVLAVIMIVVGGIKYMTTDAFQGKSEAKTTIQNAIFGLLLALGAWIILYTIDPKLVEFKITAQRLEPLSTTTATGFNQPWPDDSAVRNSLPPGITVNLDNCAYIGEIGCTSLYGLSGTIISLLSALDRDCRNCTPEITGGTEFWLHGNRSTDISKAGTEHVPGGMVVDLGLDSAMTVFLRFQGRATNAPGCAPGSQKYIWKGATFVLEGNHWHICTYTI